MDVPVCAPRARFASGVSGEPRVASVVVGVGQPASAAASFTDMPTLVVFLSSGFTPRAASAVVGVGQPAIVTTVARPSPEWRAPVRFSERARSAPLKSETLGVGQPVHSDSSPPEPLPDVRGADARSAQICGPDAIAQSFQIEPYSGEPAPSSRARNLLPKHDWRAALTDEAGKFGPEVSLIFLSKVLASDAKRLAGAAPGPHGPVVGPPGEAEREAPPADARKEVALGVAVEVLRLDIDDAPLVDDARRNLPSLDELAEPFCCERVVLVVVGQAQAHLRVSPRPVSFSALRVNLFVYTRSRIAPSSVVHAWSWADWFASASSSSSIP